ncbi:MAG: hypothetical protein RLZZ546_85, partial [Bacteroidota bacterium]
MSTNKKSNMNDYLKYSTLGLNLAGLLLICIWLGRKADTYIGFETPLITIVSILLVFFGFIYKL